MNYTEQLRRLLEGLYIKTMSKEVNWSYDEANDLSEASIGNGYVQIVGETDEDGDFIIVVKILSESKQVIDRVYGGSYGLGGFQPYNTGHNDYWHLIRELKASAQRAALGADVVIDSILERLGSKALPLTPEDEVPF